MPNYHYKIRAKVWLYAGKGAWHFVTLPKKQSEDIRANFGAMKRGWGSIRVVATIGKTIWRTSIFPDKQSGAYLLPIKADVREHENIVEGDTVTLFLEIRA